MNKVVLSAALAIVSGAAFAQMTAVEDEVLSAQTGQDGISIALNVRAHIDAFEWIDTDANGGAVRFEDIAIGAGTLTTATAAAPTGFGGLNAQTATDGTVMAAKRSTYSTGIRFGGPINIDVEDVAGFSYAANNLINSPLAGTDVAGDTNAALSGAGSTYGADAAYVSGYSAHVPTVGTKAVVIGLPRMVMSFNVGAIRVVPSAVDGSGASIAGIGSNGGGTLAETYSMGGIRVTNFDFSSTKVSIWGHK